MSKASLVPRMSLENPLIIKSPLITIANSSSEVTLENFHIKVLPTDVSNREVNLGGEIENFNANDLASNDLVSIENLVFLVSEFESLKPKLSIEASDMRGSYMGPLGPTFLDVENLLLSINISEGIIARVEGEQIQLDLSQLWNSSSGRVIVAEKGMANVELQPGTPWSMPIDLNLSSVRSENSYLADKVVISGDAIWEDESSNCSVYRLLKDQEICGQVIHMMDFLFSLDDSSGKFKFSGNGYCIAPNSGCPQKILSKIASDNTAGIFSNIMGSGLVNPLVGGIILGGLLSSPTIEPSIYDHKIDIKVLGSQIFMNGQPLIN
jgi:hypothetical protein